MDITSYLLGKQAGGGGSSSLGDYFNESLVKGSDTTPSYTKLLKKIPDTTTVSTPNLSYAFYYSPFETIPLIDTSSVTDVSYFVAKCSNLVSLPAFNFEKVSTLRLFARDCSKLVDVPIFKFKSLQSITSNGLQNIFTGCSSLSNDSLNNILKMLATIGSGYQGTKTLAHIGLSNAQITTCQSLSNYQEFLDAGWTAS